MSDDQQQMEDAPAAWGASTRITVLLESEAAAMLDELAQRFYPNRRPGMARASHRACHSGYVYANGPFPLTLDHNGATTSCDG